MPSSSDIVFHWFLFNGYAIPWSSVAPYFPPVLAPEILWLPMHPIFPHLYPCPTLHDPPEMYPLPDPQLVLVEFFGPRPDSELTGTTYVQPSASYV